MKRTLDKDVYAVEKIQFSFVASGRDLIPKATPDVEIQPPLVLADPDFNSATSPLSDDANLAEAPLVSLRGDADLALLRQAPRLPKTADEAQNIVPHLAALIGGKPRVFLRAEASETRLKATPRPQILVAATHGFFFADESARTSHAFAKATPRPTSACCAARR